MWTVVLEKTLESPLACNEIQPVHSEGHQPWDFFGRNDAEAETPVLWPPHAKSWLIGKDSDAGRDWGKKRRGRQRMRWLDGIWLDGRESDWTPGVGDGQGGPACCDSWGHKESDTTERPIWSDLIWWVSLCLTCLYSQSYGFFPVVMYRCNRWTIKKAECWRTDTFKLWCWRRLLSISWTARRSKQSILKEINPQYSLEGLMLELKLQYFGYLMGRADSSEKTVMLGKIEGRSKREWQRIRWLDGITNSIDMNLSKLRVLVKVREAWCVAVHWVTKRQTQLTNWTTKTTALVESW